MFDFIYNFFGKIFELLYTGLCGQNFGITLIVYTLILKLLLMPLSIKGQKSTMRMSELTPKVDAIKRRYKNDQQKQNEEIQKLYKQENVGCASGCLPTLIQFPLLIAMYRVLAQPLTYIKGVSKDVITQIMERLEYAPTVLQTTINNDLISDPAKFELVKDLITPDKLINMKFLGMNLGLVPKIDPSILFGAETIGTYLPIIFLPLISVALVILSQYLTDKAMKKRMPVKKKSTNTNEAPDMSSQMNKTMKFLMPAMTLWIGFTLPVSMSLYWIFTYIVQIGQHFLIEKIRKDYDAKKEAEAVRSGAASQGEDKVIEATYEVKEENKESKDKNEQSKH
ncbi:MAG: YidC/Oxa1 family membrane protein insertase [Clostridia bacterium]|jgi:YidC/Oxa1 family membrane protein insertase|nr:membrane protein insertase YidC [Clostridia bacterium]NLV32945.1 YidC/Oxa1 family membrane protein insertase [Clostridiaceae bacterium]HPB16702.1 YidC/Oxa1 family membrane protein insertase [Clostridia bacterium]HQM96121.1 YidC/Oxa1 family membrane protein insertase [Clostridia bacterium]HQO69380.1 YidC/Oxa1 family membrane protein insertase [Clostridia bacterium]